MGSVPCETAFSLGSLTKATFKRSPFFSGIITTEGGFTGYLEVETGSRVEQLREEIAATHENLLIEDKEGRIEERKSIANSLEHRWICRQIDIQLVQKYFSCQ